MIKCLLWIKRTGHQSTDTEIAKKTNNIHSNKCVSSAADTAQAKDAAVGPRQGTRPRRPNTRVMGADWAWSYTRGNDKGGVRVCAACV